MNNEPKHRQLDQFVGREVFHCVSHLVTELYSKAEHFPDYEEDLYSAWHAPLTEEDYCEAFREAMANYGERTGQIIKEYTLDSDELADCDSWQEACELHDIDPSDYRREVFEHWIVSDWLANRLEEHGELVLRDLFGLTVWGRTCTGQAIALDSVIGAIYDALHQEVAA